MGAYSSSHIEKFENDLKRSKTAQKIDMNWRRYCFKKQGCSNDSSIDGSSLRVKAEGNYFIESYEELWEELNSNICEASPPTILLLVSHNF